MHLPPLAREFYGGSALEVAPRLLGHWLVRRSRLGIAGGRIVEVEAYLENDPACHAFGGKTGRNATMWGPPGFGYVYFIYGMHYCFNAVCLPEGRAEAVLIRAIEPDINPALMQRLRAAPKPAGLTNGPAKLCQALAITRHQDGADLCRSDSEVFIAANRDLDGFLAGRGPVVVTPRVGITAAADRPYRFLLPRSPYLSKGRA